MKVVQGNVPPVYKLGALTCVGIGLYCTANAAILVTCAIVSLVFICALRIPASRLRAPMRALAVFVFIVFLAQWVAVGAAQAIISTSRMSTLFILAVAMTLTTTSSELIQLTMRVVSPLGHFGVNTAHIGLSVALVLRFIPELRRAYGEIREAQIARGCGRSLIAPFIPLCVRVLTKSDEISMAIDARCYGYASHMAHYHDGKER
jgi:biotin transport system permease protein